MPTLLREGPSTVLLEVSLPWRLPQATAESQGCSQSVAGHH